MVKRRKRPLRYAKYRPVKLKAETDERLVAIAEDRGMKVSQLLRLILDKWVWGHDNGPGKTVPPKPKNEKLKV